MQVVETTPSLAREEILKFASVNKSVSHALQRLLNTASRAMAVPAAFTAFFNSEGVLHVHQWYGFDASGTPESSFLNESISFYSSMQVIEDATQYPSLANDVWATNGGVRFFASFPVKMPSNTLIGVFCILDSVAKELTNDQRRLLQDFGAMASEQILLRFDSSIHKHAFRKTETECKHTRQRMDRLVSSLPIPLFSVDASGGISKWNRACADTFGYSNNEIIGKSAVDTLVPEEAREKINTLIGRVYNRRRISGIDLQLCDKEGSERVMHGRLFPQFDAKGNVESCIVVVRDTTDPHKGEQDFQKTEARYRAITEDLMRLKATFLANMSHEIRTPLTSIIGFADILGETVDESNKEFTQLIEESAQRLMDTLNSVLNLAQLEAHSLEINLEPLDLFTHAQSISEQFAAEAAEKDVTLTFERLGAGDTVTAYVDEAAHTRVVKNLIGNAVKFTRKGEITVAVSATPTHIIFTVTDTGIGISKEFLPHIFNEFQQESSGIARTFQGSGLGLAITKRLVDLMGGTIDVESKKGSGTTCVVSYPRYVPEALAA